MTDDARTTAALLARLGIRVPVFQGGMTYGSDARLVAAVSEAGGLGTLGTFHYREPAAVAREIDAIRAATRRPFAVNVPFFERSDELCALAAERGAPILALGGWCSEAVARLKERHRLTLLASVNSPTAARALEAHPIDVLIAQGNESGGANASHGLRPLLQYLLEHHPQPVVAAGGLWDGRDLYIQRRLGAAGIQLGTRFLFAEESPLHSTIKRQVASSAAKRPPTTQLVPVGETLQMRFLANAPFKQMLRSGELLEVFSDKERVRALSAEFFAPQERPILMYAGAGIHQLRDVQPVAAILDALVTEHDALVAAPLEPLGARP